MKEVIKQHGKVIATVQSGKSLSIYEALDAAGIQTEDMNDAEYKRYIESLRMETVEEEEEEETQPRATLIDSSDKGRKPSAGKRLKYDVTVCQAGETEYTTAAKFRCYGDAYGFAQAQRQAPDIMSVKITGGGK